MILGKRWVEERERDQGRKEASKLKGLFFPFGYLISFAFVYLLMKSQAFLTYSFLFNFLCFFQPSSSSSSRSVSIQQIIVLLKMQSILFLIAPPKGRRGRESERDRDRVRKRANHKAQSSIPQAEMGSRKEKNIPTKKQNRLIIQFQAVISGRLICMHQYNIYTQASSTSHLLYTVKYEILEQQHHGQAQHDSNDMYI